MNKVVLIGRLTRDPEIRVLGTGTNVANFALAINRPFKNKDGNIDADFINITVYGRQVDVIQKYTSKGSQICVEGRIQTRSYDAQDGTKRYATDVIAESIELLGSRRDNSSSGQVNAYVDTTSEVYPDQPSQEMGVDISTEDPFKSFGSEVSLSDDDLPF